MKTSQSFPFYPTDFLIGSMFMTPAQVGGYIRALCYQWESGGFPMLPEEQKRVTGCDDDDLKIILGKFVQKRGVLVNERMEVVRKERLKYYEVQRVNGKKGGRPSGNPRVSNGLTQIEAKKTLPSPSPSPFPSPSKDKAPPTRKVGTTDAEWYESLKANPEFQHVRFDHELSEAKAWIGRNPKRQFTRRFFENWIRKVEKPIGAAFAVTPRRTFTENAHMPPEAFEPIDHFAEMAATRARQDAELNGRREVTR